MKIYHQLLTLSCGAWLSLAGLAQSEPDAAKPAAVSAADATTTTSTVALPRDDNNAPAAAIPAPDNKAPVNNGGANASGEEPQLRFNFRNVPLEMVLDYLSDAAGFIIVLDSEVKGKVDVWSNQPLNRDEAIELLNTVLGKNGYTALRNGRTLTIISRDDAKRRDMPVRKGADPTGIPRSDEMVTQIIPVRFISAVQLTRDLATLIPPSASVASNEGGNALIVTDTQVNIRRLAEIVHALDTSIQSVTSVRVFPLKYSDAKALATVVRDLFTSTDSGNRGNNNQQQNFFRGARGGPGGGGGFPGGFPGGGGGGGDGAGGGGGGGNSASSRVSTAKVTAVADERSNSLVVAAPEEQMTLIAELITQVDTNVEDVTELRVFHLKYADPQEMAEVIAGLFPDPNTIAGGANRGGQVRFGGFAGPFGGGAIGGGVNRGANPDSTRLQKQSKVITVPDLRTGSIVVSAAREVMGQIASMVEQLDSDPAKKQKVFVFDVQNTDPQAVEEILKGLFEGQNSRNRTATSRNNNRQTGNQLNNRATQNQNQGQRGTGNSFGGGGNTGGFGGQQAGR